MARPRPADVERAFFAASHWGCLLFLAALAVVAAATTVHLLQRGDTTRYEGTVSGVEVLQRSPRQASYRLTLEEDGGELLSLRLLNQGRVLAYLQSAPAGQRVQVEVRDGLVRSLTVREQAETITEREAPAFLLAAATVLSLLLLAAFAWPLVQARSAQTIPSSVLSVEEEE